MVKEYLKELGYKEKDIEIILQCEQLKKFKEETLSNNIKKIYNFLLELQYTHDNIIKMTKTIPAIYGYGI